MSMPLLVYFKLVINKSKDARNTGHDLQHEGDDVKHST